MGVARQPGFQALTVWRIEFDSVAIPYSPADERPLNTPSHADVPTLDFWCA